MVQPYHMQIKQFQQALTTTRRSSLDPVPFMPLSDISLSSSFIWYRFRRRFGGSLFLLLTLVALVLTVVAVHESIRSSAGSIMTGRRTITTHLLQQADEAYFHQSSSVMQYSRIDAPTTRFNLAAAAAASDAASIDKNKNREANDKLPWFVMHVGPPKTAVRLNYVVAADNGDVVHVFQTNF
jgi:hypothetical protein